jgi:hypothetical protein
MPGSGLWVGAVVRITSVRVVDPWCQACLSGAPRVPPNRPGGHWTPGGVPTSTYGRTAPV